MLIFLASITFPERFMADDTFDDGEDDEGSVSETGLLLRKDFLGALRADFAVHGADVIAACRADDPSQYMKLIAALLPKSSNARAPSERLPGGDALAHLNDQELLARIRSLEAAIDASTAAPSVAVEAGAGTGGTQTSDRYPAARVLPPLR
jgi:hypothetical protein